MINKKIAVVFLCIILICSLQPDLLSASDKTPPVIKSTTPANGSADFCANATITVQFNEPIRPGKNFSNISILGTEGNMSWGSPLKTHIIGNMLQIKTVEPMPYGSRMEVRIPSASIADSAGNSLAKENIFRFSVETGVTANRDKLVNNEIKKAITASTNKRHDLSSSDLQRLLSYEFKGGVSTDSAELQADPDFTEKMKMLLDMAVKYVQTMENYDYRTLSTASGKEQYKKACLDFPPLNTQTSIDERIRFIVENKLIKNSVFVTSADLAYINESYTFTLRGVEYFTLQGKTMLPDKKWNTSLENEKDILNSLKAGVDYQRDIEFSISLVSTGGEKPSFRIMQRPGTLYTDSTPPSVSAYPSGGTVQPYGDIILKASDLSGIRVIRYAWDDGNEYAWPIGTTVAVEVPNTPGRHVLRFQAQDRASRIGGNSTVWKTAEYVVAPSGFAAASSDTSWTSSMTVKKVFPAFNRLQPERLILPLSSRMGVFWSGEIITMINVKCLKDCRR